MTVKNALRLFKIHYLTDVPCGKSMSDYYCGITNDLKRREKEHNAKILFAAKMSNTNEAKEVETKLHDMGFDTGKQLGNGSDDSVFVYIYRKDNNSV